MPSFQHIQYLFLLAVVPVLIGLFVFALYRKKQVAKKIGDEQLVKQLTSGYNTVAYLQKFILILLAVSALIIAFANPRKPAGSEKVSRNGIDVMIALDVSKSMLAQDIQPSRLDRAKQLLGRLIDQLSNDRIGIVIFAGKAYLQMPLTGDHSAAKLYLSAAGPESVPSQGTVIADALKMCYAAFDTKEKKYKAVVLISDGEDHDESAVNTAEDMAKDGVVINTIGIGSPQGSVLIDENSGQPKTDKEGNTVISKLNEDELRTIAEKGNGKYTLFQSADDVVSRVKEELAGMDQRNVTDDSLVNYKSYAFWLLLLALAFLVAEILLSERKRPAMMRPAVTLMLCFLSASVSAQTEKEKKAIKNGNDSYKKNDYAGAQESYEQVLKLNPENPVAQFNRGNALYRSDKKDDAVDAYDKAAKKLENPVEKSNAYYNKGVVLQNDKKLKECIDAYKAALKLDPANEDARQNLQKALQQQKQEQQQKEENKKQDPQKQNKPKDKEDQKQQPKQQQSKLSRKDAEQKLKALMEQEKNLQDKMHKINPATVSKPEKDW